MLYFAFFPYKAVVLKMWSQNQFQHHLGSWLEIQKSGTQAKLTESKTLALGPSNMCWMRTSIDSEIHSYKAHYWGNL